ncbi:hypothetical protein PRUPE_1G026000 [Prunus persica]|uniref:Uncharacterized protein n=1 Tax=Prunus persica TaxID=3760 RepID=A0A251QRM2_PRUPE|nr:hypothetical protein PRUPE_1G026000 [Prunus persica]
MYGDILGACGIFGRFQIDSFNVIERWFLGLKWWISLFGHARRGVEGIAHFREACQRHRMRHMMTRCRKYHSR